MEIPENDLTEEELQDWENRISGMSHIEMARMWRFAPAGHPVFSSQYRLFKQFKERFNKYGGFNSAISKLID